MTDAATDLFDNVVLAALHKSSTQSLTVGQMWGNPVGRGLTGHLTDMRDRGLVTFDRPEITTMETVVSLPTKEET